VVTLEINWLTVVEIQPATPPAGHTWGHLDLTGKEFP